MILISVDLPAPLSPASASTSPAASDSDTRSSACTPPKRLEISRTSSSLSLIDAPAAQPLLALIDQHRDDDDDPDGDELPEWLDVDEHQPVLDHGDDQRPDQRADDGAGAAEQAGAADHHRGD